MILSDFGADVIRVDKVNCNRILDLYIDLYAYHPHISVR